MGPSPVTSGCSWLGHFSHHQPSCVSSIPGSYLHLGDGFEQRQRELLVTSWDIGSFSTGQGPPASHYPPCRPLSLLHTCWQGLGAQRGQCVP